MKTTGQIVAASHPTDPRGREDRERCVVRFQPDPRTELRHDGKPGRAPSPVAVERFSSITTTLAVSAIPRHTKLRDLLGTPMVATISGSTITRIEAV